MTVGKPETTQKTQQGVAKEAKQLFGVINADAALANFAKFVEARQQLAQYAQQEDAKIAAEPDENKRQQLLEEGKKAYAEKERGTMEPVIAIVKEAIDKVKEEKQLEMVFNIQAVAAGGTDITADVIEILKTK